MNWIKRIWHDPVWSKVIAGVILAAFAALYAKSDAAVRQLGRLGAWLGLPSGASNGDIVFIIMAASAVLGAVYAFLHTMSEVFRAKQQSQAVASNATAVNKPDPPLSTPASAISSALSGAADLNDCFAQMKALEGRFFEAEQYRKSIVGNRVFFRGPIEEVSEREREEGGVVLRLRHAESWPLVFAHYSAFFRTLAFSSLPKGEVVTVLGTLKRFDRASASLEGESLMPQTSGIVTTEPERVNPAPVKDKDDDDAPIAEGFEPTDAQTQVLAKILDVYPREIDLDEAHKTMGTTTPAHAERQMELLAAANVVRIRRISESAAHYGVTPAGRDFAMAWLDELINQH